MNKIQNERWVDALPDEAVKVAEDINIEIAKVIAERIKAIGQLSPSDIKKLSNSLQYLGADFQKITKLIAQYSKKGQTAVVDMLKKAADANDEFADVFYSAKGIAAHTWRTDTYLSSLVEAMARQTVAHFTNLSNTLAYKIDDRTLPLRQMYTQAIDKAIYEVHSGTTDYYTAMRKTIRQLSDDMRVVKWESGYVRRLDSHVRQNMLDGVKQLNQQMMNYHGAKFGADGVELSAHAICAPDHLPVQGRQFSNSEFDNMQSGLTFEDVKGKHYSAFRRPIGEWNCRHFAFPIIIGISQPAYTEEQLKKYAENSATKYELTQVQRATETKLRKLKNQRLVQSAAGDELGAKQTQRKINELQAKYRKFSEKNNIAYQPKRATVEGYRRISAQLPTVLEKTSGNITPITDKSINSVKNIKISGYSKEQCEQIQTKHKELLAFSRDNNDSKECAFICENDFSDFGKDLGTTDRLEFKDGKCVYMLSNRPNLFVMHNHPKNSGYSTTDIRFFIETENIKHFSIVKNNGNVEVLTKNCNFDILIAKEKFRRAFKKYVKIGNRSEFDKAIEYFLNNSKEMIEWTK